MNKATDANNFMQAGNFIPAGIILIGLTPAMMVLLPWDFGAEMNHYRGFMRGLSLTVPLLEMTFVLLATARGFSLFAAVREAPTVSKAGFAMLVAVVVAGAAFSSKVPILSLIGLGKIVIHALFFLAIRDQLSRANAKLRNTIWTAIGLGLLAYWAIWGFNIWAFEPRDAEWVGLVPAVTNVRGLGFFALAGFFAGAVLALSGNSKRSTYLLGTVISASALIMILWTGSRGGLIAVFVALSLLAILSSHFRVNLAKFSIIVFPVAVSISLLLPTVNPSYGVERIIFSSVGAPADSDPSSGRIEMWVGTIEKIKGRPIAGWGVEQFATAGPEKTLGFKQPHNMILQLLFSTGILGAIAALLITLPFLPRLHWDVSTPDRLAAWGLIAGTLTFGLYDAAFYYTYPVMIFLIAVAMVLKPFEQTVASDRSD